MKPAAVYALTNEGACIGKGLAERMDGDLFVPRELAKPFDAKGFDRLLDLVAETFPLYRRHIFVTAVAIAVRAVAPHLRTKAKDPAVVALDQKGRHVVSVLSGHLGGANRTAMEVAAITGGVPVITTATDTEGLPSIDLLALERGLAIENTDAIKAVNKAILNGDPVQVYDPDDWLGMKEAERGKMRCRFVAKEDAWAPSNKGVWVTWRSVKPLKGQLVLHPPALVAGVGCNLGTKAKEVQDLMEETFLSHSLSLKSLRCMATIEAKRREKGLMDAATGFRVPLLFLASEKLRSVQVPNPSATVKRHMGVSSVCEAAALLGAGANELLVPKTKSRNATLAVALQR